MYTYIIKFGVGAYIQTINLHFLLKNSLTAFEAMLDGYNFTSDNRPFQP